MLQETGVDGVMSAGNSICVLAKCVLICLSVFKVYM